MNKKIILSLAVIGVVAAIAVGGTVAYFTDTETSTGNTFTAGILDLKVDSECTYNGVAVSECTWGLKDLDGDVFFNYNDIKPGDSGENTISLHVQNDAYVCAEITNLVSADNSCTEPELESEPGCATSSEGELAENLVFTIWMDTDCDNILNGNEVAIVENQPAITGLWPIADSRTAALPAGETSCVGVAWSLPATVGNEAQSDSLTGDIEFTAIQARNNSNFVCGEQRPPVESLHISLENKDASWGIISNDNTYGDIQYSNNDTTFHGTVTGTGLIPGGKYQITLNGPYDGCSFTNLSLGNFAGGNTFSGGFWNSAWPNLSSTCTANDEEGLYNMNLIGNHYTFIAGASGEFNYPFTLSLPAGTYSDVKVLVKKMLDTHVSPWSDTTAGYPAFNLYETAPIDFTILP